MADRGASPGDIGGIPASISIDTAALPGDVAIIAASLTTLEGHFARVGAAAAASTSRVNAGMTQGGRGASRFGMQLQVVGQTLDDLQYVGEMGLRPIINNLMQINPLLGTSVLMFDALRRSGLDFGAMWTAVMADFSFDRHDPFAEAAAGVGDLTEKTNLLWTVAKNFTAYLQGTPGVYKEWLGIAKSEEKKRPSRRSRRPPTRR